MFCSQCGIEVFEGRTFCQKCGNRLKDTNTSREDVSENDKKENQIDTQPSSITTKEDYDVTNNRNNIPKNKQNEKVDNLKSFSLFGRTVTISLDLANYNVFHCKYKNLTDKISDEFPKAYKNSFNSIEQVLNGYPELCESYLLSVIKIAVDDLIHNKVFDIDAAEFIELHIKRLRELYCHEALAELKEQYEYIVEEQAEKNEYRTARRQNRAKWVGGGFGVRGAIKGAVQASAFNAVGGVAHGMSNVIGSTFSAIGTTAKKIALFNNHKVFEDLYFSLVKDCEEVVFTLVDILIKNGYRMRAINDEEKKRANTMFQNVSSSSFPTSDLLDIIIKVILTNPYEIKYYQFFIDKFRDQNLEIEALAQYFGVDIAAYKSMIVRKYYASMEVSTCEEAIAAKEKCIQKSEELGGVPKDLMEEIDALINSLLLKSKNAKAMELLDSLPITTEQEILESKKRLLEYCDEIELTHDNLAVTKINEVFEKFDTDVRTVDGIEFKTREEAAEANDEKENIERILSRYQLIFRQDYINLIEDITSQTHCTTVSDIYIHKLQSELKHFDKKCKSAARYQYRKDKKLRIYSGDLNVSIKHWCIFIAFLFLKPWIIGGVLILLYLLYIFLIRRKKEKKLWNELTKEGNYNFADIVKQEKDASAEISRKIKLHKSAMICEMVAVLLVTIIFITMNWNGKTDYEATVREHRPFDVSQGLPYTYGEVLDKYMSSSAWEVRKSNDINYIDISGVIKGTDNKLAVTISVLPDSNDSSLVSIKPESITFDGEISPTQDDAVQFLYAMFTAYNDGYNDLSELLPGTAMTEVQEETSLVDTTTEAEDTRWNVAYATKVGELTAEESGLQFNLINLTGSDIPALVADYSGYDVSVFLWTDGILTAIMDKWVYGVGGNLGYEYIPGANVIRNYNNEQAGAIVIERYMWVNDDYEIVELYDEMLRIQYFRDENSDGMIDENEQYSEGPYYYYGDTEITAEEYASYQIIGDYENIRGDKSVEELLSLLNIE